MRESFKIFEGGILGFGLGPGFFLSLTGGAGGGGGGGADVAETAAADVVEPDRGEGESDGRDELMVELVEAGMSGLTAKKYVES